MRMVAKGLESSQERKRTAQAYCRIRVRPWKVSGARYDPGPELGQARGESIYLRGAHPPPGRLVFVPAIQEVLPMRKRTFVVELTGTMDSCAFL